MGGFKAHHLMIAYAVRVSRTDEPLRLQTEECDRAVWLPPAEAELALRGRLTSAVAGARGGGGGVVSAAELNGIYPNAHAQGIGLGHAFVLSCFRERFAASEKVSRTLWALSVSVGVALAAARVLRGRM
mmetsp:Transcript_17817/g.58285  ORF Transcript_17817/g.58285 Transcript_17817/m.58285 type:complete len:129 (-) Transcript_17817:886-1272(-)